jgi:hypothetical protein
MIIIIIIQLDLLLVLLFETCNEQLGVAQTHKAKSKVNSKYWITYNLRVCVCFVSFFRKSKAQMKKKKEKRKEIKKKKSS